MEGIAYHAKNTQYDNDEYKVNLMEYTTRIFTDLTHFYIAR